MNADTLIGGMMLVTGAASAVTGGAATGGETVVTGDSSASVQVTNVINADNNGGTAHTIIEKTINGVKEVTEETKNFAPGEPVEVTATAEARAGGSSTSPAAAESSVDSKQATATSSASSTEAEPSPARWSFGSYVIETISSFFTSMWSWWSS